MIPLIYEISKNNTNKKYTQNRNRLTDIENKLVVNKGEKLRSGRGTNQG